MTGDRQEGTKMSVTDNVFEEVIDVVSKEYALCVSKARELFTDEQAVQSASATMFINATKEKSTVVNLVCKLRDRIDGKNPEAIPSAVEVWKWHFAPFIKEFGGRISGTIAYYVSQNCTPEEMERNIRERYYHLKCESDISDEERAKLEKELFGEN